MKTKYFLLLLVLTGVYSYFGFATPVDLDQLAKYNFSLTSYHWLLGSIILLISLIWWVAFYGFSKFKDYAEKIKNRSDGQHLATVANGLEVLAIGVALSSVFSSIIQDITMRNLSLVPRMVIFENYVSLAIAAVAYYLMYTGAKGLVGLVNNNPKADLRRWWFWGYVVLAVLYLIVTLSSDQKSSVATLTSHGLFYLPNGLLIITLLLPYVVVWYLAIKGPLLLAFYRQNTKGAIYKAALRGLSVGLMIVVGVTILLQFLTVITDSHSSALANASRTTILAFVYLLIVLISVGFLVIARGAKKLKLIEEV